MTIKITLEFDNYDDAHYMLQLYRLITLSEQKHSLVRYVSDNTILNPIAYIRDLISDFGGDDEELRSWLAEMTKYERAFAFEFIPELKDIWPKDWGE